MTFFELLLKSKEFWAAVILLVTSVVKYALPDFPETILNAVIALLGVIAGLLSVANAATLRERIRRARLVDDYYDDDDDDDDEKDFDG